MKKLPDVRDFEDLNTWLNAWEGDVPDDDDDLDDPYEDEDEDYWDEEDELINEYWGVE